MKKILYILMTITTAISAQAQDIGINSGVTATSQPGMNYGLGYFASISAQDEVSDNLKMGFSLSYINSTSFLTFRETNIQGNVVGDSKHKESFNALSTAFYLSPQFGRFYGRIGGFYNIVFQGEKSHFGIYKSLGYNHDVSEKLSINVNVSHLLPLTAMNKSGGYSIFMIGAGVSVAID